MSHSDPTQHDAAIDPAHGHDAAGEAPLHDDAAGHLLQIAQVAAFTGGAFALGAGLALAASAVGGALGRANAGPVIAPGTHGTQARAPGVNPWRPCCSANSRLA